MFQCQKNKIKKFYYGKIQEFTWDNKQRLYVSTGERSIFLCDPCQKCREPNKYGLCEFTDTDSVVSQG